MLCLDRTLPTPAENLACDEALLDAAEAGAGGAVLRFWEPREYFVVLGYANHVAKEVDGEACRAQGVPVLRRCSGGGAVLQGPGCLNYNLVLEIDESGPLASVTSTNRFILQRHAEAVAALLQQTVHVQGHTDLTLGQRKFSGNSQRRKHRHLIFHGSILLDFDVTTIERLLRLPSQQPDYRQGRAHRDFLINLKLPAEAVKAALQKTWKANERLTEPPQELIRQLVEAKYSKEEWNLKFA